MRSSWKTLPKTIDKPRRWAIAERIPDRMEQWALTIPDHLAAVNFIRQ